MEGLAVSADSAQLATRQGPVFGPLSFSVPEGGVAALAGSAGSGKTSAGLALCGRMKFTHGTIHVGDSQLPGAARKVRRQSAVTLGSDLTPLQGTLRIADEVNRAFWLAGRNHRGTNDQVLAAAGLSGRADQRVRTLTAFELQQLTIALAFVPLVGLVFIDDLGSGVPVAEHGPLWALLARQSQLTGATAVAATLEAAPAADAGATVVVLEDANMTSAVTS